MSQREQISLPALMHWDNLFLAWQKARAYCGTAINLFLKSGCPVSFPMRELSFLGYQFRGKYLIWSKKSLQHFKYRIRQLTNRTWGVSWAYRYRKLREYVNTSSIFLE